MSKWLIASIFGALAVGLIAGCGSGGGGSTSTSSAGGSEVTSSSVTKTAYIVQADAVCKKTELKIEAELNEYLKKHKSPEGLSTPSTKAAATEFILLPAFKIELKELEALGVPSGDEETISVILDKAHEGVAEIEKGVKTANRPPALEKANELSDAYGFKVCVQS